MSVSPAIRPRRILAMAGPVLAVFGVLAAAYLRVVTPVTSSYLDLDVYLRGAQAVRDGEPLYAVTVSAYDLHFTYPPFAAVFFEPLTVLDPSVAHVVFTLASVLAWVGVALLVRRSASLSWYGTALFAAAGAVGEPFLRTLWLGQVNLVLLVAVLADLLVVPARWRGWLTGVAAGVKLVPGIFVLYFLLRRDRRAAAQAASGFLATVLVGFAAAPAASWDFWTGGFLALGRFGDGAVRGGDNQSLVGVLLRLTHQSTVSGWVAALCCLAAVALGAAVAARLLRNGDRLGAFAALALAGLLGSPVSWSHHWVWALPVLAVLAVRGWWLSALLFGGLLVMAPMWLVGIGSGLELTYDTGQQVVAAAYVIAALLLLARLALGTRADPRTVPPAPSEPQPAERSTAVRS